VEQRRQLAKGGEQAIGDSEDPMIALARTVDPYARSLRRKNDDLVRGVQSQSYANISRARYAVLGGKVYPDATFTLRLAFGVVKGWEAGGKRIPPFTTIGGAFRLHEERNGEEPYRLPRSWLERAEGNGAVDLSTHLNFVSTPDIVGGNSGSPVINRKAELVGLIFDGNLHSLVLDIAYTEERARAISVSAEAILEALRSVYRLDRLVTELVGKKARRARS
jgi:hypothetical protein